MNNKDIAFWIMILSVIILSVTLTIYIRNEGMKCLFNPLVFGVSKYSSSDGSELTCSCSTPTSSQAIIVTKDNITIQDFSTFSIPIN